jgi:hypothetical protein
VVGFFYHALTVLDSNRRDALLHPHTSSYRRHHHPHPGESHQYNDNNHNHGSGLYYGAPVAATVNVNGVIGDRGGHGDRGHNNGGNTNNNFINNMNGGNGTESYPRHLDLRDDD